MYKHYHHHLNSDLQMWGREAERAGVTDNKVTNTDCVPTMCQAV